MAEAIRAGWADAGVCLRLVSDQAGLDFLSIREEAYDLCFSADDATIRVFKPGRSDSVPQLP